jgi:hypothetical protein
VKVYINKLLQNHTFRQFIARHEGSCLLWLWGVNVAIDGDDIDIEPVYIPALTIKKDGGVLAIDIRLWRESCRTIIFFNHPPYFWTGTAKYISLGDPNE